jgi:molybdopterin/thiamine biosynthesis adenylyltransferase/rhodanese-related sulfurtransferase
MQNTKMSSDQYLRYNRHLLLSEVGVAGQQKLLASKVLLVGVGGLGSPAATYLAAAGVGKIGLVDFDVVDLSNLQRQLLYTTSQIGLPKVFMAAERLRSINSDVQVVTYCEALTSHNALEIFADYDVILDATDNLASRYLINDACVLLGKKYVFGSIYNFEGRVSVFGDLHGPCYRCVFPVPPDQKNIHGSLDLGVFGMLPGVIGIMQATEAVKLICNIGNPLIGRIVLYDALEMTLREMKISKNNLCPICGQNKSITELSGHEKICNLEPSLGSIKKISATELIDFMAQNKNFLLLDVRDTDERYQCIDGAVHVPINDLHRKIGDLISNNHERVVVFCQTGPRSVCAARAFVANGYKNVFVLDGGILAWLNKNKDEVGG